MHKNNKSNFIVHSRSYKSENSDLQKPIKLLVYKYRIGLHATALCKRHTACKKHI